MHRIAYSIALALALGGMGLSAPAAAQSDTEREAIQRAFFIHYDEAGKLRPFATVSAQDLDWVIANLTPIANKYRNVRFARPGDLPGTKSAYGLLRGAFIWRYPKTTEREHKIRLAKAALAAALPQFPDPDKKELPNGYPTAFGDARKWRRALDKLGVLPPDDYVGLVNGRWVDLPGAFKRSKSGKLFMEANLLNIHAGRTITAGLRFVDAKNGKTYVDLRTLPKSVMEYCNLEPGGGKIIGVKLKKPEK